MTRRKLGITPASAVEEEFFNQRLTREAKR
jgi:hypothetical protein